MFTRFVVNDHLFAKHPALVKAMHTLVETHRYPLPSNAYEYARLHEQFTNYMLGFPTVTAEELAKKYRRLAQLELAKVADEDWQQAVAMMEAEPCTCSPDDRAPICPACKARARSAPIPF